MNSTPMPTAAPPHAVPVVARAGAALRGSARGLRYAGAGALIAVGYMDPGNWATALAAGAQYGYALLSAVALSSAAALLLQWLSARVGVVTGRDLAELCRDHFGRRTAFVLWIASEIAIVACDVAEVIGAAVALQLLLGISLTAGVLLSALGTFALLALKTRGMRTFEAAVIALILLTTASLAAQLALARPDWQAAAAGLVPSPRLASQAGMLWLAAGIVGATVMPHNLYLHAALVKRLPTGRDPRAIDAALTGVGVDAAASLGFAFLVNAALLIVAAAVFHAHGQTRIDDLRDAHRLLAPLVGNAWAAPLFAGALLACGLNSTVTGTLAGQTVMEGFVRLRLPMWQRALLTRSLALGPALLAAAAFGERGSNALLVASQVVLSLQLPLALVPLVRFASQRRLMDRWAIGGATLAAAWGCTAAIVLLNGMLIRQWIAG